MEKEESREQAAPKEPSKLEYIWVKMDVGQYDEVIADAKEYFTSEDVAFVYESKKLAGLAYFQSGQYNESAKLFEEICATSDSPDDFFNLITSATMSGDFDKAEKAIAKACDLIQTGGKTGNISIPNMRFYYMHALRDAEQWDRAFEQLKWLGNIYQQLHITDSTFLYIRGVPFMERTMEAGVPVLEHIPSATARNFIKSMTEGIDEEGKSFMIELEKGIHYGV